MDSDAPLDYALFQLSPRRSRCELFVSGKGRTEKIASGFLKPFITHLKAAEEQSNQPSIKLQIDKRINGSWFNKGTLERFVRFVTTPEILELPNTFDAEMSQLEGARKIYSQGASDSASSGANERASAAAADITKRELLKAIDVRLMAVKQDLTTACTRATSAGFTLDTVSDLHLFSDHFRAHRLKEACTQFISLCQSRPDLVTIPKAAFDDSTLRCSSSSDMSLDEPEPIKPKPVNPPPQPVNQPPEPVKEDNEPVKEQQSGGPKLTRRLSVQDRISMFEKQASSSTPTGGVPVVVAKQPEHRRVSSITSLDNANKAVLRRWSGASSDMSLSLDLGSSSDNNNNCMKQEEDVSSAKPSPRENPNPNPRQEDVAQRENPNPSYNEDTLYRTREDDKKDEMMNMDKEEQNEVQIFKKETPVKTGTQQVKTLKKGNVRPSVVPVQQIQDEPVVIKDIGVASVSLETSSQKSHEIQTKSKDAGLNRSKAKPVQRKAGPDSSEVPAQQSSEGNEVMNKSEARITRQAKGSNNNSGNNNEELQMKAEELEKLFAAHKLRVQNENNTPSTRRNPKPRDVQVKESGKKNETDFDASLPVKMVSSPPENSTPSIRRNPKPKDIQVKESIKMNGTDFDATALLKMVATPPESLPEELRGKFYEKYTIKREAKLKEEWRCKRDEKEASLRAMHDSLERSRAELRVKFAQSDPGRVRTRYAKKHSSVGSRSELRGDQGGKLILEDEDEDRSYSDNLSADGSSSKSTDSRKHKKLSTSTPRVSSIPPKPSPRTMPPTNPNSRNPLAQSVPNFGDFRKENTRPSVGPTRGNNNVTTSNARASQVMKSYARSKSIIEESDVVKEEDISRRTQSMRKSMIVTSTMTPTSELQDISTLNDTNHTTNFAYNGMVPRPVLFHDPIRDEDEDFDTTSVEEENPNPSIPNIPEFPIDSDTENPNNPLNGTNIPQLSEYVTFPYQNDVSDSDSASWSSSRKKWGTAQNPSSIIGRKDSSSKDMAKGFKRLLKFGRKSGYKGGGVDDWASAASTTSAEGDEDFGEGEVGGVEEFRRSNLGYSIGDSFDGGEQGQSLRSSIPNAPISFKLREDHLSGSSIKAPRSFFSLSTFRNKGSESKLR